MMAFDRNLISEAVRLFEGHAISPAEADELHAKYQSREDFLGALWFHRGLLARSPDLSAPPSDVDEHLTYVATQQGFPATFDGLWEETSAHSDPLDASPTAADVELVVFLLLGREPPVAEIVKLMRKHRSLRSMIMAIIEEDSFVTTNARLLSAARHASVPPINSPGKRVA